MWKIYSLIILVLHSIYMGLQLYADRFRVVLIENNSHQPSIASWREVIYRANRIESIILGILFIMLIYCTIKDQRDKQNNENLKKYILINMGCIAFLGILFFFINKLFSPIGSLSAALFSSGITIILASMYYLLSRGYGYLKSR